MLKTKGIFYMDTRFLPSNQGIRRSAAKIERGSCPPAVALRFLALNALAQNVQNYKRLEKFQDWNGLSPPAGDHRLLKLKALAQNVQD